jgi:uncharacterized protein
MPGAGDVHVTVIAKAPVPGRVKSRLCPPCSFEQAAEIAAAALADTFDALDTVRHHVNGVAVERYLLLDGEPQPWMPSHFAPVPQRGDGLGERLRNGFADLGAGAIVGMETPHVAHLLDRALDWLAADTDVLGPAEDGGYWMIGLGPSALHALDDVFRDVPMSAPNTGEVQLRRLRRLGRPVQLLPAARDLDTIDDLRAVALRDDPGRLGAVAATTLGSLPAEGHETGR